MVNVKTNLSSNEWSRFEAARRRLGIEDEPDALELAVLESVDDFDHDTIRRIFLAAFGKQEGLN